MEALDKLQEESGTSIMEKEEKLEGMKQEHISELKKLQTEFEQARSRLTEQIDTLSKEKNELEIQTNIKIQELEEMNEHLSTELSKERDESSQKEQTSEQERTKIIEEIETRYKSQLA